MWPWNKQNKSENSKSSASLTREQRIIIEDKLEDDWEVKDIAEDMSLDIAAVHRAKELWKNKLERAGKLPHQQVPETSEASSLKKEIEQARLQEQLDEIKHKSYMRQLEREAKEAEMSEDDIAFEDVQQAAGNPDKMMEMLMFKAIMGGMQQQPQQNTLPIQNPVKSPENAPDIRQIVDAIKQGVIPDDIIIKKSIGYGINEEEAKALIKALRKTK